MPYRGNNKVQWFCELHNSSHSTGHGAGHGAKRNEPRKIQFYASPFASSIQRTHAHHYYNYVIPRTKWPYGGSSALPRHSSYTAAPRRTAPGPSNFYLTALVTIHSSYGCLVKIKKSTVYVKDRCDHRYIYDVTNLKGPPATSEALPTTSEGAWAFFQIMPPCRPTIHILSL